MSETAPVVDRPSRPTVYVETSVISYLAAALSRDVVTRGHQESTRRWWSLTSRWQLVTSTVALGELARGDHATAVRRLEYLQGLTLLKVTAEAKQLAVALLAGIPLPPKAKLDADHIAVAATNGVAYIVTWNLKHIANPTTRSRVERLCLENGYRAPIACTPENLLQVPNDVH